MFTRFCLHKAVCLQGPKLTGPIVLEPCIPEAQCLLCYDSIGSYVQCPVFLGSYILQVGAYVYF